MKHDDRRALVDTYFAALDEEDPTILEPAVCQDFVYRSLSETFEGYAGFERYMTEYRTFSGTDHRLDEVIHGANRTAVEGHVVGVDESGDRVEARFCDVFGFDDADESLTFVAVYLNDELDMVMFTT